MKVKRFLAMLLAVAMVMVGGVMAFAEDDEYDPGDVAVINDIISKMSSSWEDLSNLTLEDMVRRGWVRWTDGRVTRLDISNRYSGSTLDVSQLTELEYLNCSNNNLTALNVSKNAALETLDCSGNKLTELDVSKNAALETLDCYYNKLTELDVSKNAALRSLHCIENKLTSLDVSGLKNLEMLLCGDIDATLTSLDFSGCTSLTVLRCGSFGKGMWAHSLSSLDVSELTELTQLDCDGGLLTSLDLSHNSKLESLSCGDNKLTDLNLSKLPNLTHLACYDNQLKSLDLSHQNELTYLSCDNNQLSSLNVSNLSELETLYCSNNQLTTLDVSKNPNIKYLYCNNNDLASLILSSDFDASYLNCTNNYLSSKDNIIGFDWDKYEANPSSHYYFTPQKVETDLPESAGSSTPPADDDNNNTPTKPSTSTTPKEEKESPRESSNQAAENDALKSIERANKALQAAESGSSVSSSKVQSYIAADGASVPAVSVKLYGFGAGLSLETMRTLAEGSTGLRVNLDNGAAQVLIPAGFPMPNIPGVLGYALGYQKEPSWEGNLMRALVKDPDALTETHRLGGGELPVAATVTLKTKLSGSVNVYYWDASTRKAAFLASGNAQNGKVSFATKQLGNLIVTNGTI